MLPNPTGKSSPDVENDRADRAVVIDRTHLFRAPMPLPAACNACRGRAARLSASITQLPMLIMSLSSGGL